MLGAAPPELPPVEQSPKMDAAVSLSANGSAYVLFDLGNGQHLQLIHDGTTPTAALVPAGVDGLDRLEAVHRLLAALHGRAIPPDTRLTRQQRARLRRMLQAFDGDRAGATRQELARAIFRIGPISRDEWQTSSVRHAVKALIRDARAMIAGGYRNLLRHRRPK